VTAPILWLHFGAVPLFSVASNALAFPVVGPLLAFAFMAAALDPVLPSAAFALAWVNGWLAAYLAWCARAVGGLPHAQATSLRVVGLVAVAVIVAALVARLHGPRRTRALALAAAGLALVVAWRAWLSEGEAAVPPTGLRITFLDVGQGDATLIQVPEGAVLVDQGPPEAGVVEQLARLGVDRLSILVMTHPSRDNIGGAEDVVDRMPVDLLLDPDLVYENPYGDPALAEARRRGVEIRTVRAGQVFRLGGLRLEVLWPPDPGLPEADPNDRATVLVASFGETDALLPADAEANVTLPLRPPPVEILKVAHHGSADPQLNALLELVRPQIAVISVGHENDYGHPTPSTLDALQESSGLAVYRTDEDGRITVESDGRRMTVGTGS
jgi:competence protein ComEC